jgi:WD40 repeat protein
VMKPTGPKRGRTLDPLATLITPQEDSTRCKAVSANPSAVTGVCFLSQELDHTTLHDDGADDSDSSSEDGYRCQQMLRGEKNSDSDTSASAREAAASVQLLQPHRYLASCNAAGDAYLWDLGTRRIVQEFGSGRGHGLSVRRMGDGAMYHTRDDAGIVSFHSFAQGKSSVLLRWETLSRTFCTASPCEGSDYLLVLPSEHECYATVRDVRVPPDATPLALFHGTGDDTKERTHGMLSSVAMCMTDKNGHGTPRPMVACGMESGSLFFHDLGMSPRHCEVQVSARKDPILGMDITSSSTGALAVVGLGADTSDLLELSEDNQGTVALVKLRTTEEDGLSAHLRARVGTCDLEGGGKPGVNTARFRPDGRLFAIGGWDNRLRIFDRVKANPLAILRGHTTSVKAIDWAPDSASSGLLATGGGDGKILLWQCFSSSQP